MITRRAFTALAIAGCTPLPAESNLNLGTYTYHNLWTIFKCGASLVEEDVRKLI